MEQNTHRQKPETDIPEVDRQVLVLNGTAQVLDTLKVKLLRVFLTIKTSNLFYIYNRGIDSKIRISLPLSTVLQCSLSLSVIALSYNIHILIRQ